MAGWFNFVVEALIHGDDGKIHICSFGSEISKYIYHITLRDFFEEEGYRRINLESQKVSEEAMLTFSYNTRYHFYRERNYRKYTQCVLLSNDFCNYPISFPPYYKNEKNEKEYINYLNNAFSLLKRSITTVYMDKCITMSKKEFFSHPFIYSLLEGNILEEYVKEKGITCKYIDHKEKSFIPIERDSPLFSYITNAGYRPSENYSNIKMDILASNIRDYCIAYNKNEEEFFNILSLFSSNLFSLPIANNENLHGWMQIYITEVEKVSWLFKNLNENEKEYLFNSFQGYLGYLATSSWKETVKWNEDVYIISLDELSKAINEQSLKIERMKEDNDITKHILSLKESLQKGNVSKKALNIYYSIIQEWEENHTYRYEAMDSLTYTLEELKFFKKLIEREAQDIPHDTIRILYSLND